MSTQIAAIKQAMVNYFVETAGIDPAVLAEGSVQVESLGIDSLSMIEMLWDVEEKFGVRIEDISALKNKSLDQIAEFISLQLAASGSDAPKAAPTLAAGAA